MRPTSVLATYALFWVICLFIVLPFGVRTDEEMGAQCAPGHAPSAPHRFSFGKAALRATIVSAILFAFFAGNYHYGWIGPAAFDWIFPPRR
jgi:predicted secreted protein